eukprot:3545548-Rhodomonas_salina.1
MAIPCELCEAALRRHFLAQRGSQHKLGRQGSCSNRRPRQPQRRISAPLPCTLIESHAELRVIWPFVLKTSWCATELVLLQVSMEECCFEIFPD